jgi:hypothetical protein
MKKEKLAQAGESNAKPEQDSSLEKNAVETASIECAESSETEPSGQTLSEPVPVEVSVDASVPDPVSSSSPATKPLSAMERLRALKSGNSNSGLATGSNGQASVNIHSSDDASLHGSGTGNDGSNSGNVPDVERVVKPRKTHPIAMEMAEIEAALNERVPGFVSILSTIHKKLRADPNIVTLLDDEEIGVIVSGLEKHTNVTIVAPSAIKAAKSKARREPVSAGDL